MILDFLFNQYYTFLKKIVSKSSMHKQTSDQSLNPFKNTKKLHLQTGQNRKLKKVSSGNFNLHGQNKQQNKLASEIKYRVAIPNSINNKTSERFWIQANKRPSSGIKTPNMSCQKYEFGVNKYWRNGASKLNDKIDIERRVEIYSKPFSFLASVGGKNTKIKIDMEKQKDKQKQKKSRILSPKMKLESPKNLSLLKRYSQFQEIINYENDNQIIDDECFREICINNQKKDPKSWSSVRPISGKTHIKKLSRQQLVSAKKNNENTLIKATNDTFYYSPVEKIAINMQYNAKLKFEHLNMPKQYEGNTKLYLPIQYGIQSLKPKIANTLDLLGESPVLLCIFPEYFDANPSVAEQIRNDFLSKLLNSMKNTYDPEYLIKQYFIEPISKQYYKIYIDQIQLINNHQISAYNEKWLEKAINYIDQNLYQQKLLASCIKQIWTLYEQSMRRTIVNYILQNPAERKRLNVESIPKDINSIQKIIYFGGYSTKIYSSWNSLVEQGKRYLKSNLIRYNKVNLKLKQWFSKFEKLLLMELLILESVSDFGYCIEIQNFDKMQEQYFSYIQQILGNVWIEGIIEIIFFEQQNLKKISLNNQIKKQTYQISIQKYYKNRHPNIVYQELFRQHIFVTDYSEFKPSTDLVIPSQDFKNNQILFKRIKNSLYFTKLQLYQLIYQSIQNLVSFIKKRNDSSQYLGLFKLRIVQSSGSLVLNYTYEDIIQIFDKIINRILDLSFEWKQIIQLKYINNERLMEIVRQYLKFNKDIIPKIFISNKYNFTPQINQIKKHLKISYNRSLKTLQYISQYQTVMNRYNINNEITQYNNIKMQADFTVLKSYKQKLNKLESQYHYGIFCVNIDSIKYLVNSKFDQYIEHIQKIYKKIIYTDFQNHQKYYHSLIDQLMVQNNSCQLLARSELFYEKVLSTILPNFENQSKLLINNILLLIQSIPNNSVHLNIIPFFMGKLLNLYKMPKTIRKIIEQNMQEKYNKQRENLENKLKQKKKSLQSKIEIIKYKTEEQIMNFGYISSKFKEYNQYLNNLNKYVLDIKDQIDKINTDYNLLYREQCQDIVAIKKSFEKQEKSVNLFIRYWKIIYQTYLYLKSISKCEIKSLPFDNLYQVICKANSEITYLQANISQKNIYHKYLNQFKEEIKCYNELMPLLKLLSMNTLVQSHYKRLPNPKEPQLSLKIFLDQRNQGNNIISEDQLKKITQICDLSINEDKIKKNLNAISQKLKAKTINVTFLDPIYIIEWHEQSIFIEQLEIDLQKTKQIFQKICQNSVCPQPHQILTLRQNFYQITNTLYKLSSVISQLYETQELYVSMQQVFRLEGFNFLPEERQKFDIVIQVWRQIIKIIQESQNLGSIFSNNYLNSSIKKSKELLGDVKKVIYQTIATVCENFPRLYLIPQSFFFETMCKYRPENIEKAILTCFPFFQYVELKNGKLEAIGRQKKFHNEKSLKLIQCIQIKKKFIFIDIWMKEIQESVQSKLMNNLLDQINHVQNETVDQIKITKILIDFTTEINSSRTKNQLQYILDQYLNKIKKIANQFTNQHPQNRNYLIINLIIRDVMLKLIQDQSDVAIPKYYMNKQNIQLEIQLNGDVYYYGFQYIHNFELTFTDFIVPRPYYSNNQYTHEGIQNICYLMGHHFINVYKEFSYTLIESILKASIASGIWLIINNFNEFNQINQSIIYQSLILQNKNQTRKQKQNFFISLNSLKSLEKQDSSLIKFNRSVELKLPSFKMIMMNYSWHFGETICQQLGKFIECLEEIKYTISPKYINNLIKKIEKILQISTISTKSEQCLQDQIKNILLDSYQHNTQVLAIIKAIFKQVKSEIKTEVNLQIYFNFNSDNIIFYGQNYLSRKSSTINTYLKQSKSIKFYQHLPLEKVAQQLSSIHLASRFIIFDRFIQNNRYYQLKSLSDILKEKIVIFEEENIFNADPAILIECKLVFLSIKQDLIEIPIKINRLSEIFKNIESKFMTRGVSEKIGNCRLTFKKIYQGLIKQQYQQVPSFLYSIFWSYGQFVQQKWFLIMLKDELKKFKEFNDVFYKNQNTFKHLEIEGSKLKPMKINPEFCFSPHHFDSIYIESTFFKQLHNLESYINHPIIINSTKILTSFIKPLTDKSHYIHLTSKSSYKSLLAQMKEKCMDHKQLILYKIKPSKNNRIVIDDIHLTNRDVISVINQLMSQKSIKTELQIQDNEFNLLLGINPNKKSNSDKNYLQRIVKRCANITIAQKVINGIYDSIMKIYFKQNSEKILQMIQKLKSYQQKYQWFKVQLNVLLCPIFHQKLINSIPLKENLQFVIPKLKSTSKPKQSIIKNKLPTDQNSLMKYMIQNDKFTNLFVDIVLIEELLHKIIIIQKYLKNGDNTILFGANNTGKKTAIRIASVIMNYPLFQGSFKAFFQSLQIIRQKQFYTKSSKRTISQIPNESIPHYKVHLLSQNEIDQQALTSIIKYNQFPTWLYPKNILKNQIDKTIIVLSIVKPNKLILPQYFSILFFDEISRESLYQISTSEMTKQTKQIVIKQNMNRVFQIFNCPINVYVAKQINMTYKQLYRIGKEKIQWYTNRYNIFNQKINKETKGEIKNNQQRLNKLNNQINEIIEKKMSEYVIYNELNQKCNSLKQKIIKLTELITDMEQRIKKFKASIQVKISELIANLRELEKSFVGDQVYFSQEFNESFSNILSINFDPNQIKSVTSLTLNEQKISKVTQLINKKQNLLQKNVKQWLLILIQLNKLRLREKQEQNNITESYQELKNMKQQNVSLEKQKCEIEQQLRQSKVRQNSLSQRFVEVQKQYNMIKKKVQKSAGLNKQFENYNIVAKLKNRMQKIKKNFQGDLYIATMLLLGVPKYFSINILKKYSINFTWNFNLPAFVYDRQTLLLIQKKTNISKTLLEQLIIILKSQFPIIVQDIYQVFKKDLKEIFCLMQPNSQLVKVNQNNDLVGNIMKYLKRGGSNNQTQLKNDNKIPIFYSQSSKILKVDGLHRFINKEFIFTSEGKKIQFQKQEFEINNYKIITIINNYNYNIPTNLRHKIGVYKLQSHSNNFTENIKNLYLESNFINEYTIKLMKQNKLIEQKIEQVRIQNNLLKYLQKKDFSLIEYENVYNDVCNLYHSLSEMNQTICQNKFILKELEKKSNFTKELEYKFYCIHLLLKMIQESQDCFQINYLYILQAFKDILSHKKTIQQCLIAFMKYIYDCISKCTNQKSICLWSIFFYYIISYKQNTYQSNSLIQNIEKQIQKIKDPKNIQLRFQIAQDLFKKYYKSIPQQYKSVQQNSQESIVDVKTIDSFIVAIINPYHNLQSFLNHLNQVNQTQLIYYHPYNKTEDQIQIFLKQSIKTGGWVIVINAHLYPEFINQAIIFIKQRENEIHRNFKLFITLNKQYCKQLVPMKAFKLYSKLRN